MKNTVFMAMAFALTFALVSCESTKQNAQRMKLEKDQSLSSCGGNWNLVLLIKGGTAQMLAKADLTISPSADGTAKISGFMGANRFMGTISSESNGMVKTASFASTRRGGSAELMEFERLFSEFMNGIDSYSVGKMDGEEFRSLVLTNSTMDAYARFTKNTPFYATWKLLMVNSGNAVESVNSDATITIEQNSVAVFTGINRANLGLKITEEKGLIAFSDGPMTRAAGSDEEMRVETLLMQNLFKAERYELSGDTLSLYAGDTLLLEFERQVAL